MKSRTTENEYGESENRLGAAIREETLSYVCRKKLFPHIQYFPIRSQLSFSHKTPGNTIPRKPLFGAIVYSICPLHQHLTTPFIGGRDGSGGRREREREKEKVQSYKEREEIESSHGAKKGGERKIEES